MSILMVQPCSLCDSSCLTCPWKKTFGDIQHYVPTEALSKLEELVEGYSFSESMIICPNPLQHPDIERIVDKCHNLSRKVCLFLPISFSTRGLKGDVLKNVDLLSIVIPSYSSLKQEEGKLRILLSQGIEFLEAYVVYDQNSNPVEIMYCVKCLKKYGIRTVLGPPLYQDPGCEGLLKHFSRCEGVKIGLSFGRKYMYHGICLFFEDFPVVMLTSRAKEGCQVLYVDPYGNYSKCPLSNFRIGHSKADIRDLRKIIFSGCPLKEGDPPISPKIEISFVSHNGVEIPQKILELLEMISQTYSFRAACKALGVPPSTLCDKMRRIEEELGVKLTISVKGGKRKGITLLTEFGRKVLEEYKKIREKVILSLYERSLFAWSFEHETSFIEFSTFPLR